MIKLLHRQIPFISIFKNQVLVAIALGFILALIMIFLGPFDTDRFESSNKTLILIGFGVLLAVFYCINSRFETRVYHHFNRKWTVTHEALAFISLVFVVSIPIHFYNQVFLNNFFDQDYGVSEYIGHGLWFFKTSMIPIMLLLLPFFLYLRNTFGQLVTPESLIEVKLRGINKGENIKIQQQQLLFVKSSENYVEIFYEQDQGVQHIIFRNTLSNINKQAPFLKYCHRSYLVNTSSIKQITGNSQNAKIGFHDNLEIPLSTTYYKDIKSSLSIKP